MFRFGKALVQHATSRAPVVTSRLYQPVKTTTSIQSLMTRMGQLRLNSTTNQSSFVSGFNTQGNAVIDNIQSSALPSTQFKTKKPSTPGKRWLKRVPRDHLYKGKAVRALTVAKRSTGGRNNTGRITIRHRGGGHKRRIRLLDWHRREPGTQTVVRLEHDPGRTAWIALLKHDKTAS